MAQEVVRALQVVNLAREQKAATIFRAVLSETLGLPYDAGDRRYRALWAGWRRQLKTAATHDVMQELYAPHLSDRDRKRIHSARGFSPEAAELWSSLITIDSRGADANAIRKAALVDPDILEAARAFVLEDRDVLDANTLLKRARAVLKEEAAKAKLRKGR
jgi:hypothetical protein